MGVAYKGRLREWLSRIRTCQLPLLSAALPLLIIIIITIVVEFFSWLIPVRNQRLPNCVQLDQLAPDGRIDERGRVIGAFENRLEGSRFHHTDCSVELHSKFILRYTSTFLLNFSLPNLSSSSKLSCCSVSEKFDRDVDRLCRTYPTVSSKAVAPLIMMLDRQSQDASLERCSSE